MWKDIELTSQSFKLLSSWATRAGDFISVRPLTFQPILFFFFFFNGGTGREKRNIEYSQVIGERPDSFLRWLDPVMSTQGLKLYTDGINGPLLKLNREGQIFHFKLKRRRRYGVYKPIL